MISVIIFTKNRKYGVLDVPQDGKLQIKEEHLLCAVTQNGVKMIPYGAVLSPFEIFIWDNTLDSTLLPSDIWQPEGRILDFSQIELLQDTFTINPTNSGSENEYVKPTFTDENGFPIEDTLMVSGLNFQSVQEAEIFFRREARSGGQTSPNCIVNNMRTVGDKQYLSLHNHSGTFDGTFMNQPLLAIEDLKGVVKTVSTYCLQTTNVLQSVILPYTTNFSTFAFYQGSRPDLQLIDIRSATTMGSNAGGITFTASNGTQSKIGTAEIIVPIALQTINSGAEHGDLVRARNNGSTITYV